MPMVGTGDADSNAIANANTNNGANDCQHKAKLLKVKVSINHCYNNQ